MSTIKGIRLVLTLWFIGSILILTLWSNAFSLLTHTATEGSILSETNSFYFRYTCASFPSYCNNFGLLRISNTAQFNKHCESLFHSISAELSSLNPLFILSFRREYFFMLQSTNNIDAQCSHSLIYTLFKTLHESQFHHKNHSILYHTHISKAAGTSVYEGVRDIARLIGWNDIEINHRIKRNMYGLDIGVHIFEGLDAEMRSFPSCEWLYEYLIQKGAPIRVESEAPLTRHRVCPQFYNSVILRAPIDHRLSMLAFLNRNAGKKVSALYCINESGDDLRWKICTESNEMNGFMTEIFDNDLNVGHHVNMERIKNHERIQSNDNESIWMEYINPKHRHFGIGWRKKRHIVLNTSQLIGWLTNTYVRWIGYKHKDNDSVIDSMNANYLELNEQDLFNSKRILLHYDYVLPMDHNFSSEILWKYYAKEIEIHMFGARNKTSAPILPAWERKMYFKTGAKQISTDTLKCAFGKSEELKLLTSKNKLDLALFAFSKQIANADRMFLDMIGYHHQL